MAKGVKESKDEDIHGNELVELDVLAERDVACRRCRKVLCAASISTIGIWVNTHVVQTPEEEADHRQEDRAQLKFSAIPLAFAMGAQ